MRGTLLRIFLTEEDRCGDEPLYHAIVEALRAAGFAGASVLKGIDGFGLSRRPHSIRTVEYGTNLPVLIEVMEREQKVLAFLPRLRAMVADGVVTLERVELLRFGGEGQS